MKLRLILAVLLLSGCVPASSPGAPPPLVSAVTPANFYTEGGHQFSGEIFHPVTAGAYPLIVFSHGNFASPDRYHKMLKPIAAAGYIIAAPTHLDAEILAVTPKPDPQKVWKTRNAEMAFLGRIPGQLRARLPKNVAVKPGCLAVMGHSYGALMAQLAAGARATEPDGSRPDRKLAGVDALIAWSPPGPIKGRIDAAGWSQISVPSLTITGNADILPGFIDDWRLHKAAYEAAPVGGRWLWVGEGIDHYFGGMFGREKTVSETERQLFKNALTVTISFLDEHLKNKKTSWIARANPKVELKKD